MVPTVCAMRCNAVENVRVVAALPLVPSDYDSYVSGGQEERLFAGQERPVWSACADRRLRQGIIQFIACASYPDGRILRSQVQLQAAKYDDVLIDVGGRDSTALRAALTLCDVLLVPIVPRSLDVWALDDMVGLIEETAALRGAFPALAVLNQADPRGRDNDEAADLVAGIEALSYLPTPVRRRKAVSSATGQGMSAAEYRPADPQAIAEMEALANVVFSIMDT